jgi:hypothetical protein
MRPLALMVKLTPVPLNLKALPGLLLNHRAEFKWYGLTCKVPQHSTYEMSSSTL